MENLLVSVRQLLQEPLMIRLLQLVVGVLLISLLARFIRRLALSRLQDVDTRYRVRKFVALAAYALMFIYAIATFSDNLQQFTVIFGVVGAGITLALQDIIASLAGWVAISLRQFYQPGDRVLLAEVMGDVIDIGLLSTTLMECGNWVRADLYNGRIIKVPNNAVFKGPVVNYSADFPFVWDELVVPIRHGCDRTLTAQILQQAAATAVGEFIPAAQIAWERLYRRYLIESASVSPMITLKVTENWIEYTLRYVVDYKQRRAKQHQIYSAILEGIDQSEGRVAIAVPPIQLVQTPPVDVRLTPGDVPLTIARL